MRLITRRAALAAGGTLATTLVAGKPKASETGDVTRKLMRTSPRVVLPDGQFVDDKGQAHTLAEFRGHGMVINFWATWCAPCVAEMPSLAALSRILAPDDIAILPLSADRGGASVVGPWFEAKGISGLPVLLDPKGVLARAWGVRGLPTTVIIDRAGRDCGRLEGSADWDTPEAAALIRTLVKG